jgi:AbrB family looped-hinge helix DNA binding protein
MRVTSKGQVTIPRDLRERAGIATNSEVVFSIENGKIFILPKSDVAAAEEEARMKRFLNVLDRLEGTGDQELSAEDVMTITRDR